MNESVREEVTQSSFGMDFIKLKMLLDADSSEKYDKF